MSYVLALDQGTTSSRALLFDADGAIAGQAQSEFPQRYPQPGWVEHDPEDLLISQLQAAVAVLTRTGVRSGEIAALGIANQRETTLVWDRESGRPIYPAIVWQDRRTAAQCQQLQDAGVEAQVRQKTGLLLDPYFCATKIAWILDHVEGARARAAHGKLAFGTVDSWLVWNLTGGRRHVTDRTNAARTLLFNIVEDRWDDELLRLFDIPESLLPEVVWSSEVIGEVTDSLGLGSIRIAGIAGDQQAALFGQLCLEPGDAKNTYGTGCFLLQHIGDSFVLSQNRLLTTLACSVQKKPAYALEGSVFIGGAVVQWLRDQLRLVGASADIEALAASVPNAGGLIFVPAFVGLGAPYWDPYARGLLMGLERGTGPGHIARAALESIAFQVADALEAMEADSGLHTRPRRQDLRVDGGASANNLLMQLQADLLGMPVVRPPVTETTALGAAYLAGLAVGFWSDLQTIIAHRPEGRRFVPRMDAAEARRSRARWRDAVGRARGWAAPEAPAP